MRIRHSIITATVSILALATSTNAQAAVDAQKVVDAFAAKMANVGLTLTTESVELSGSNVIAKGITLSSATSGSAPMKMGDVTLENVAEDGAGYTIGQVSTPASKIENENGSVVEFGGASIKNMKLTAPDATDPLASIIPYEKAEMGPLKVSAKGEELFHMDGATVTMSSADAGQPMNFELSTQGIVVNLNAIAEGEQNKALYEGMGYSQISGVVTAKGSWNPTDGRMTISEESIDFKDVGRLNFTLDLSGYTSDFLKSAQDITKIADKGQQGMAMMGLVQKLNFHSMTLSFDDASLTGKALDYAAKASGQPREALIAQAKGMAPLFAMQLQDPEFATSVTTAVSAFLDDPKRLEIKAAPAAAIPFSALLATGMTSPPALIKQLGVTVTANQ
jgi:hypothetical protein